jgi:hypothetical protein
MKEHRAILSAQMSGSSQTSRALFCLACAERTHSCCWAFQKAHGVNVEPFFRWLETLWGAIVEDSWEGVDLDDASKEIEAAVPRSDEYGSPLATQAQAGMLCVLAAVNALQGKNQGEVVEAANGVVDALDNFAFFVREQLSGQLESPQEYDLLRRELSRQLHDAHFLQTVSSCPKPKLVEWRIENRHYVVPIAVLTKPPCAELALNNLTATEESHLGSGRSFLGGASVEPLGDPFEAETVGGALPGREGRCPGAVTLLAGGAPASRRDADESALPTTEGIGGPPALAAP